MADFKQITVGGVSHSVKDEVARQGLAGKQDKLTFDDTPTANSDNPVKSGGVYQAIQSIDVSSQISGKEDKSNKVTSFSSPTDTQYPSAKLVSDQLATKQGTISDLSTIRSGASAGATAYQKPGTGIPKTDLASAVQTSLGKADTAIQSVTVGTTTTGAAGSSASVTNTGTATEPVLSFTIPQGAQGIQGIQGPQGERGPQGNTGVQVDSVASIIHSIDPTATYAAADVAGADAVQDVLSEVTELAGKLALGAVYDISAENPTAGPNSDGKWETLSTLLSDANLNTLIPTALRKGGMSIKFIQSSDNKYVQYRLMHSLDNASTAAADFMNEVNWQGVDEEPTAGSKNLVESGGVYDEVYQLGQIVSESFDSYNVLTAYQSGLPGYVSADLTFGLFGTHSIYLLPDSNLVYAIDVNYPGGGAYYYTLTDENDNILEQVKSADIFGSETSGIRRWIFKINPNAAKIYVSYNPSVIQLFASSVVDVNNEIFKRLSFGNFEVSNVEYKNETGNQVLSSSNSCLQTKFSGGKPVLEYEVTSVSVCRLFDIAAINQNGWRYIYISLPYIVEHQDIDARYVNLVVLDGQDNVISATIIKGSIIQVPYKCRVLLVGTADAVVYEGCNVEKINTQAIKQLDDKTIIISYIDVSPASVGAAGYVSNSNVGTTISFGGWFKHNVYSIEGNKKYKITINEYPNGAAYAYAITDSADKILQIVTSGQIFGDDHTTPKSFIFNSFANQAKLYVTCVTTASDDVIVQLQNGRDINAVVNELDAQSPKYFFTKKDFACDGDSMVQWPQYTDEILNFNSLSKNSMGGATCRDRTETLNDVQYTPQWAPDCTEAEPFVDYMNIGTLTPGTAEYAQAQANNCIFGHLGRFIDKVANGDFPSPNIFVMNIMGVNDTWSTQSIDTIIGTFDNAISGSYDQLTRNTILNSVRWFVTKFRITYPNCKLFWKTSTQQTADNHTYFYKIEEELLKLLRFLSVPIIDSYAEVGIMRELEHANGEGNQWTVDGTHPTSAGYKMDGEFVASKLKSWFFGFYLN